MQYDDIGAEHTLNFVRSFLKAGDSILDVGCGKGVLDKYLMDNGFKVMALDRNEDAVRTAQELGVNAECTEFSSYRTNQRFQAIVFSRSLHHILPVETTVRRAAELLTEDGLLLVEDFGAELLDLKSALWFFGLKASLETNCETGHGHGPSLENGIIPSDPLLTWRDHHFGRHEVADSETLMSAIHKYFNVLHVEKLPYLYRYFVDDVSANQARKILDWETALCNAGAIIPIGIRCVGKAKARP